MERWTRLMLRRRWVVIGLWTALFLAGGATWAPLADLLTNRFTLPGTDTARAERILEDHFGQKSTGSFTVVARTPPGQAQRVVPQVRAAAQRAAAQLPTGRLTSVRPVSDALVAATIVSSLDPADAKGHTDDMREALGTIPDVELLVSGQAAIEHDLDPVFARDLQVGELFIAVPIALVILIFTFGTLAFLIPFAFAAASISTTIGIIWIFANFFELTTYLQNLVTLIGFGIAIDYSLLVVYRYREELKTAATKEEAVVRTMATAGRAVVFSGTAVGIGLALMLFMPLPFMRGFGLGGLAIPLVSVLCALTLLPVMLYLIAGPLDRVHLIPRRIVERRDSERNFWHGLAHAIMRRPAIFAATATAVLLALAAPVLALELGPGSNDGIPQDLEGVRGLNLIGDAVGEGALAPTAIVIDTGEPGGAAREQAAVERLIAGLKDDPEVASVTFGASPQHVDPARRFLAVEAVGRHEYGSPPAMDFVDRLRDEIVPAARFGEGTEVYAGGGPPGGVDFLDLTYGAFPWLILAVLVITYFILLRAFRSLLLPLKAILLNLLSIGAAYGLLVTFFKFGPADRVGLVGVDQVEGWIPVFVFAMVFGLSMDYEVFLVSRMREEWDAGRSNAEPVAEGLAKTGRIVTAAGLIMVAAFLGFVAGSIVGLQQFGFGLATAILLDVTIVRTILVPSAMELMGRWNWWLPQGIARVFRVEPSPLAQPARSAAVG